MWPAEGSLARRLGLPLIGGAIALVVGQLVGQSLDSYYVYLGTTAVIIAIALLGLGVVTGSAGMIALCQLSFAVIGAWVVSWLNYHEAPGNVYVWLLLGAGSAGVVGTLIGLPALRLRGVNLAVVTLGFAAAVHLSIVQKQFPGTSEAIRVLKPEPFIDDRSFFVFTVAVLIICALVVHLLQSSRVGSAWRAVAFSERGSASAGASVPLTKLSAFAVSAALAGVSGGLITLQVGFASASSFTPLNSLAVYVLAVVCGSYLIDMALLGGILWVAVPEVLKRMGIAQDWSLVVFGLLGIQALTTRTNLGEIVRAAVRRRQANRPAISMQLASVEPVARDSDRPPPGKPVLETSGLGMRFGSVVALDDVDFTLREGEIVGLIGPNGAGKSTFIDALTGFLPRHDGHVWLGERSLHRASPARRARLGLRRTFQQDRVPRRLTVESYVRFVAHRRISRTEIDEVLDFFGCPGAREQLATLDVGTRRLVEVAAQLASGPRVLLLDEPAAGLSHQEHIALGDRLAAVPQQFGTSVVLVEHDLELVRRVCSRIVVLDFGRVLADGAHSDVLADPAVLAAYMGEAELL